MRITSLFLLAVSVAVFTAGCDNNTTTSRSKSKGQLISDCMSAGGSPEECDRKINLQRP